MAKIRLAKGPVKPEEAESHIRQIVCGFFFFGVCGLALSWSKVGPLRLSSVNIQNTVSLPGFLCISADSEAYASAVMVSPRGRKFQCRSKWSSLDNARGRNLELKTALARSRSCR